MNHIKTTIALLLLGGPPIFAQPTLFAPRVDIGGVPNAACSTILDANNDGRPDIAVCAGSAVYLILQNADPVGTFSNRGLILDIGSGNVVTSVAAADFNGDGNQDLLVSTNTGGLTYSGSLLLYRGNGNGTFQAASTIATGPGWSSLAVADFNNDRIMDFAVISSDPAVYLYIGDGTGGFATHCLLGGGSSGPPMAIGDFNNDGKLDVAFGAEIFLGNGDGTAGTQPPAPPGALKSFLFMPNNALPNFSGALYFAAADLNGDGRVDLAGLGTASPGIFLGNGDGTFQPTLPQSTFLSPSGIGIANFNFDGHPDMVTLTPGTPGTLGALNIFPGMAGGQFLATPLSFQACKTFADSTKFFNTITVGDLNGDGLPDVIASCGAGGMVSLFLSLKPSVILQTSVNPSAPGQSVQITALVSPALGFVYATGLSVQLYDGPTPLGAPIQLSNGQAIRSTTSLAQGTHYLTAVLLNSQNTPIATSGAAIHVVATASCASNLSGQLQIAPGGFRRNPTTLQWTQTVAVTNTSGASIAGPLSLALDNLTAGVTALNTNGVTSCSTPSGAPFVDTGICPGGTLAAGQSIFVNLAFSNPSNQAINYTPAPLAGLAPR